MPQTRRREASCRFEMEIKPGRVHALAAMREAHGQMRLVGALIRGEARVAVDSKQRSADTARIRNKMRSEAVQGTRKIRYELQRRLAKMPLVFILVGKKPVTVIVSLEACQKAEKFRCEVGGHDLFAPSYLRKRAFQEGFHCERDGQVSEKAAALP